MSTDPTEFVRKLTIIYINNGLSPDEAERKAELVEAFGEDGVWNTEEFEKEFEAIGFMAPYVVVKRRSDGKKGSCMFSHSPRFYFGFKEA